MKKFIFAISVICYFTVTTGVVINSHYCMKRLVSVHLYESKSDVCSKCGMNYEAGNDCCSNELKVIKLDQDQSNLVYTSPGILKLSVPVSVLSTFLVSPVFTITVSPHFYNHSPPLLSASDTYLVNKVFRI